MMDIQGPAALRAAQAVLLEIQVIAHPFLMDNLQVGNQTLVVPGAIALIQAFNKRAGIVGTVGTEKNLPGVRTVPDSEFPAMFRFTLVAYAAAWARLLRPQVEIAVGTVHAAGGDHAFFMSIHFDYTAFTGSFCSASISAKKWCESRV